ncbi:hypothetical protein WA1_25425 [Scytonema hofmannii PCC 7110]|uniref:Uncharacterized protein n=1 Tax=Scytonema hofmannii PCC 7110 TaxID=128403 RepID=A0A139X8D1_9CYAN|nr:hypothetical protein [Scytonema hofmannii]KYC40957.1 hypothetical protein WA1_25425 [Scytonema hofmannii PCC 7110]
MSANTTLLALLLSLKDLNVTLNSSENTELETIGEQLALDFPQRWNDIQERLMKLISSNISLYQCYQATKAKLDLMDSHLLASLLPNKGELEKELAIDSKREVRGYKPTKLPKSGSDNEIVNDIVVPILRSDEPSEKAKQLSFLERLQKNMKAAT